MRLVYTWHVAGDEDDEMTTCFRGSSLFRVSVCGGAVVLGVSILQHAFQRGNVCLVAHFFSGLLSFYLLVMIESLRWGRQCYSTLFNEATYDEMHLCFWGCFTS